MKALPSLAAFAVAVYTLSRLWETFRSAWSGTPITPPGTMLLLLALFLGSVGYLAFLVYAADRAAGRVRRRIRLFERFLSRGEP